MSRTFSAAVIGLAMLPACAHSQTHLSVDEALIYIRTPAEGIPTISTVDRSRVLSDPRTIQFYADLVLGRRTVAASWNRHVALWWLAESGDARYVPVFLRFAPAD